MNAKSDINYARRDLVGAVALSLAAGAAPSGAHHQDRYWQIHCPNDRGAPFRRRSLAAPRRIGQPLEGFAFPKERLA
jgi:hypothetical protein